MRFSDLVAPFLTLICYAHGINHCLDSNSADYKCAAGQTISQLGGCGLTDDDFDDIAACWDNTGRASITMLYLLANSLTTIPAGVFEGLDEVKFVFLGNNQLSEVPDDEFLDLPKLEFVNMSGTPGLVCNYSTRPKTDYYVFCGPFGAV